ncbi:hypothetical protein M427DRAFT_30844 [Gonapodya prolifera JEL478]|uniref:Uncharacterized protein n=1 Tax=Gonapodya prolifera (strain JEL478) TaxID=1344416 RepID=A0A139AK15_GONPJ|nr:hypothetical protein M427DRAFT_30844 [Gonapodya prolifera JEL478]|eukprot:KXS17038.1 hypothetical protein M427DRAFT_30844 [Gonapodya prolifera JEL478]
MRSSPFPRPYRLSRVSAPHQSSQSSVSTSRPALSPLAVLSLLASAAVALALSFRSPLGSRPLTDPNPHRHHAATAAPPLFLFIPMLTVSCLLPSNRLSLPPPPQQTLRNKP